MQISAAAKLWLEYHKCHSKENSIRAYKLVLTQLCEEFGTEDLEEITTERTLSFLNRITEGRKQQTKKLATPTYCPFSTLSKTTLIRSSGILATPQC